MYACVCVCVCVCVCGHICYVSGPFGSHRTFSETCVGGTGRASAPSVQVGQLPNFESPLAQPATRTTPSASVQVARQIKKCLCVCVCVCMMHMRMYVLLHVFKFIMVVQGLEDETRND